MRLINDTIDTSNGIKEACEKEYERCKRNPNVDMNNDSKNGSGNDDNSNNNNNNISKTNNPNEGLNESKMNAVDLDNGETGESVSASVVDYDTGVALVEVSIKNTFLLLDGWQVYCVGVYRSSRCKLLHADMEHNKNRVEVSPDIT
ncbi:Hypothetical predicted protein [Octopus vulgaris]|uniref:Uncharacterized protein n=1 Tax=Octopus vulgaris TaxID=6645 RepID=A0AA36B672_OCTVU|nr:Hypothetical predicted protein [Octopus vulgaris]